jgi:hypothetical protein
MVYSGFQRWLTLTETSGNEQRPFSLLDRQFVEKRPALWAFLHDKST